MKNKHLVITGGSVMFALGESCADHFVCKLSLRPPKAIDACMKKQAPARRHVAHYVCNGQILCGSFCLQMGGGLRPPQPPRFLRAIFA